MNAAVWAWIGLAVIVAAYVVGFDLSFPAHTMSAQFHEWLQSQIIGPIVFGLWIGVPFGFLWHYVINK